MLKKYLAIRGPLPTEAALLFFEGTELFAKLGFQIADHLGGRALAELFRQIAASGELLFDCLFFPIPVHDHRMPGKGKRFKSGHSRFQTRPLRVETGQYHPPVLAELGPLAGSN